jgi:L-fuconate dehydratase
MPTTITSLTARDARFPLPPGEGSDAVHSDAVYSYAVTLLAGDRGTTGSGLAFTLGDGNDLVCRAIELLGQPLVGCEIEELMSRWGSVSRRLADHPRLRWLGPHKGVIHLALASITNAAFDLWAKHRGVPLWQLLLDLTPEQIVALLDLSYLEDELTADAALAMLRDAAATRAERTAVIRDGYPGYDTSVGWFQYSDDLVAANARRAVDAGFQAVKLKVGSPDAARDVRRVTLLRRAIGDHVRLMVDANQAWSLPQALAVCRQLAPLNPYWIEEPTHPDDVLGHQRLARAIAPLALALGEHVPNRVLFKNYIAAEAARFIQVDAVRVAGVSEFIAVSLLARKYGLKVVPHVGDMGQIHQHLVLFNHVALGLEREFLEYIPHLRGHFRHPAQVVDGAYRTPQEPGSSSELLT